MTGFRVALAVLLFFAAAVAVIRAFQRDAGADETRDWTCGALTLALGGAVVWP